MGRNMRYYDEETGLYYEIREESSFALVTDADKKLTGVTVPKMLGGCPVKAIGRKAFLGCKGLREVTLPEYVDEVGEWAFAFCDNLKSVVLPAKSLRLGKGIFKNDRKLGDISLYDIDPEGMADRTGHKPEENSRDREAVAKLLAAVPIYMDAEYLLDTEHAGSCEWYGKWDTRLMHILSLKDDEGYHLYVLCGEEDLHFDYDQYLEYNREKKAYLCMLRLRNDVCLSGENRRILVDYLLDHTVGSRSDAAIRVLLRDFGDDRDYYGLMMEEGVISASNLEDILLKMGDRHAGMKAFLIESVRGGSGCGAGSFFDELTL
ncbi:MAG TPA: hypothetical protein DIS78_10400 [Lachnospiraceae bacterium]|nr:hypothetical protein [Lachnospiraceae bacterium]